MEVALPFFLLLHSPHYFRGQFIFIPSLVTRLGIVEAVRRRCLSIGESHFFFMPLRPDGCFSGRPEEVHAAPWLNALNFCPQYLLRVLDVVFRDRHIVASGFSAMHFTGRAIRGLHTDHYVEKDVLD